MVALLVAGCGASNSHPEESSRTQSPSPSASAGDLVPPEFEDAQILIPSGVDRAWISYAIIGHGRNQYAPIDRIKAVRDDGREIEWRHQTATGGSPEIVATEGRIEMPPGSLEGGDADYFDVLDVVSSKTVTVTFYFESGPVDVLFKVVSPFAEASP